MHEITVSTTGPDSAHATYTVQAFEPGELREGAVDLYTEARTPDGDFINSVRYILPSAVSVLRNGSHRLHITEDPQSDAMNQLARKVLSDILAGHTVSAQSTKRFHKGEEVPA
jgi:hypothetical protein